MDETKDTGCCSRFDPAPWNEKEITWENKPFVQDHVRSFLHIPINFPAVMMRNMTRIEAADAKPEKLIVLTDESSLWGANVFIECTKDVPSAKMAHLSGTFLSKVFEGSFRDMRKWIEQMRQYVKAQGKQTKKLYFYYTACPKCAKEYGKNYVVLLAEV